MNHAKKLMLIDPKMYRPSMRDKSLSAIDIDIETTLLSDLPDDEKAKRYTATLKRFKAYDEPKTEKTPAIDHLETNVLQSIPPNQAYKAKRLLQNIKRERDFDWTEDGEMIYKQTKIPNSNIVDLMSDVLKTKSTDLPVGWEEFASGLGKAPQELIANTERKRLIRDPTSSRRKQKKRNWLEY
jgi:hypothetical protein